MGKKKQVTLYLVPCHLAKIESRHLFLKTSAFFYLSIRLLLDFLNKFYREESDNSYR